MMLKIKDVSVSIDDKNILNNFNLDIKINETHAIMGLNGAGKSTICKVIMGDPNYIVKGGSIIFNGQDLLQMDVPSRARAGIFLLSQNPIEIPGVSNAEMLRLAMQEKENKVVSIFEFNKKMKEICAKLDIPETFIHRGINEGMSGGERKKNELLHLWMLEPKLIILDEIDSGLDVDSLKTVCNNINEYKKEHNCAILLVSHHAEILKLLACDYVHIVANGEIIKSGDISLAFEIEKEGYKGYLEANRVSESGKDE
jgi:Fe-S cluster assembly ATP-binding protein